MGEHDRQIICYNIAATTGGSYNDLVELHPLLGIGLAVIGIDPEDLEACGPLYSSQPYCERAKSHRLIGRECSEADGVTVLVVILLSALEFYLMPLSTTVLDAFAGIKVGIDVVAGVTA